MSERQLQFSLTQVEYFVAVAETGNISAAAQRLHASQSALSSGLVRLERSLGTKLFIRQPARGVRLTSQGTALLAEARRLLTQARSFEDVSSALHEDVRGSVTVGCFRTIAPFVIPPTLRELRSSHPALEVRVEELDSPDLAAGIHAGRLDIGVTYKMHTEADVHYRGASTLPLHGIVAPAHPTARRGQATLAELNTVPLILQSLDGVRDLTLGILQRAGLTPSRIIEASSFETMRGLVSAGEGYTLVYQRVMTPFTYDGGQVALVHILDDVPPQSVGFVTAPDVDAPARVSVFRETCARVLQRQAEYARRGWSGDTSDY